MSIDVTSYLMYGTKQKYDDDLVEEVYNAELEHLLVNDPDTGYIVIGVVLSELDSDEDTLNKVDLSKLADLEEEAKAEWIEALPKYADRVTKPFELIHFNHIY